MRFLVDAQLPARLARYLSTVGHDAIHTGDLPNGNRSSDEEVAEFADRQDRVVVTKDRDFRDAHLLSQSPRRLLVVATGNTSNDDLLRLFERNLDLIVSAFDESAFVEVRSDRVIVHPDRGR